MITRACLALGLLIALSGTAHAQWTHSTTFRYARSSSIRIVEPQGFSVAVGERKDTIPAVFKLPNGNAYIWVTVTAKDGAVWRKKIEVRDRNETTLKLTYAAKKQAEPKRASGRTFIGRVVNATNRCRRGDRTALRFDVMLGGKKQYSVALNPNTHRPNVELPGGSYDVRIFEHRKRGGYIFRKTIQKQINKDGWEIFWGCRK